MAEPALRFLFAGGGTGGHLFSGIAVAELLRERHPECESLFVGTPLGLEKEIVPRAGFSLKFIEASPLKGSGLGMRLRSLLQLPKAYWQSKRILNEFRPDVVVGIGGYASGPMTLAAHFAGIPTAIIEQNSIPGFTNRCLSRFADRIFIAFAKAREFFDPAKTRLTGNPTRRLTAAVSPKTEGRFCLFILGGSQGAHKLNQAMLEALPLLQAEAPRLHFIHQTGPQDGEALRTAYQQGGFSAEVFAFLQDLGPYYAQADLMLCRAGAGTITELQNLGLPAILVPYPFAADDHQRFNAEEMVAAQAAEMVLNSDLSGAKVADRIRHYLQNPEALRRMRQNSAGLAKSDAALEVMEGCLNLAQAYRRTKEVPSQMEKITIDTNILPPDDILKAARQLDFEFAVVTVTEREIGGTDIQINLKKITETTVWDESMWEGALWGPAVTESLILGESPLGKSKLGKVKVKEEDVFETTLKIISNGSFPGPGNRKSLTPAQRRQLRDAMILTAHVREKRNIFVTNDRKGFIENGRRGKFEKQFQIRIMTKEEFLCYCEKLANHGMN